MYQIIKNVISRGGYNLSAVLSKIDTVWAEGKITDEQRVELIATARNQASSEAGIDIMFKLTELEQRIRALETGESTDGSAEEYPVFVTGKWYYTGDKCSFEGASYTCVAPEGVACVWSPADYPAYWESITE